MSRKFQVPALLCKFLTVAAGCYQFVKLMAIVISLGVPWHDSYDVQALAS
jgi:hypothetical protein